MSHLFGIGTTRQKNVGNGILIFGPRPEKTGPEGRAGREGMHFSQSKNARLLNFEMLENVWINTSRMFFEILQNCFFPIRESWLISISIEVLSWKGMWKCISVIIIRNCLCNVFLSIANG